MNKLRERCQCRFKMSGFYEASSKRLIQRFSNSRSIRLFVSNPGSFVKKRRFSSSVAIGEFSHNSIILWANVFAFSFKRGNCCSKLVINMLTVGAVKARISNVLGIIDNPWGKSMELIRSALRSKKLIELRKNCLSESRRPQFWGFAGLPGFDTNQERYVSALPMNSYQAFGSMYKVDLRKSFFTSVMKTTTSES